jgi:hypothetical protein
VIRKRPLVYLPVANRGHFTHRRQSGEIRSIAVRPFQPFQFQISTQIVPCNKRHAIAKNDYKEDYQQVERLKKSFEHVCLQRNS